MTPTTSVTLAAIGLFALPSKTAVTIPVGGIVQLEANALDANLNRSGQLLKLTSGNTGVAKITTATSIGAEPIGVIGVAPGVVTITAAANDNAAVTGTITITVQ